MIRLSTQLATRRPRLVLAALLVSVPVLAMLGTGLADRMSVGGFEDPAAESSVVAQQLDTRFGTGSYGYVLLLETRDQWVYSEANVAEGTRLTTVLESEAGVTEVVSFYNITAPAPPASSPLRDFTGRRALIGIKLAGSEDEQRRTAEHLTDTYVRPNHLFEISATGAVEVSRTTAAIAADDLKRAELIAAPLTLVGLLVVFRGARAAALPLAVAALAVLGSFAALAAILHVVDISVFARTLITALGLGLAIDYSLLLVVRFREERTDGQTVEVAVHRTMQTAGRTVAFSAATVGASLLGLLVFPVLYLRSFAVAGVIVVSCAAMAALLIVPPVLVRYGDRFGSSARSEDGFWARQSDRVMRAPVRWLVPVVGLLVMLGLPFLAFDPGRIDDRVLPQDSAVRHASDTIRSNLSSSELSPIHMLAPDVSADDHATIRAVSTELLGFDGVVRVDSAIGFLRNDSFTPPNEVTSHFVPQVAPGDRPGAIQGTWFNIVYWWDSDDPRVDDLVAKLRAHQGQAGEVLVGGNNAAISDTVSSVASRVPHALALIAATTIGLLFLMTGSFVMPVKAIVLNLLSLSATFGALVWVFQQGNANSLAGVTTTGQLDVFTPLLMFCVAFGLSMDYEIFLLARIKEEFDLSGDTEQAIRNGIGRTGPVVTAAAMLLAIVFFAISTSSVSIVRMFGFGLALAVLTDVFLVRATITPAFLKLAGRLNWWAPPRARRFHLRWGIWEDEPIDLRDLSRDPLDPLDPKPEVALS